MANELMNKFFDLGNKATKGNPVRKAYFDYCLYWIIFSVFIFLSLNYIKTFFSNGSLNYLGWGIIVGIFSWFNYWALNSFRNAYLNMKKFYDKPKEDIKNNNDTAEFRAMFADKKD